MDRARASVIGVIALVTVLSGLLWLVPGMAREAAESGTGLLSRSLNNEEANDQVRAAMDALEAGINAANPDLALVGFAADNVEWLAGQKRLVTEVIARLQGHTARLHYSHPSYYGHWGGGKEVVARRVYAGPTLVVDTESDEVVGEIERYAIAPEGRFQLHPFTDPLLRLPYQTSLGGLYAELGDAEKAFEIWRRALDDHPDADPSRVASVHEQMAGLHAEQGDPAAAHAAYERALSLVLSEEGVTSFASLLLEERRIRVLKQEQLEFKLAETAAAMGNAEQARRRYEALSASETEELVTLVTQRLAEL